MLGPEPAALAESKFRFLYLGNDLKLISAVRKVLIEPDYQMVACGDREGAVLFLKSDIHYDALLIDFEWRGKEGLELAQLAQSLAHRKRMPILVVSAAPLTGEAQKLARKAGVKKMVAKGAGTAAVTDAIRALVER